MNLLQLFESDVHQISLKRLYLNFNKQYFSNELPEITFKWSNKKRSMGAVIARRMPNSGEITIKHLEISKHLNITEEQLDALMLHEMIHVYVLFILQLAETNGGHGREFNKKLTELRKKTGINIPEREDENDLMVSDHVKVKPTVVIMRTGNGSTYVHAVSERGFQRDLDKFIARFQQGFEYDIILTSSNEITKIPVARGIGRKGAGYYKLNDTELKSIRDGMVKRLVKVNKDGKVN